MTQKATKSTKIMMIAFGQVLIGARFEFRGKRYEKMSEQFGRDEDRNGNLFHQRTEVIPMEKAEWRMKNAKKSEVGDRRPEARARRPEGWWLPKPEDWFELEEHDEAVRKAAVLAYWRRPARRAGRLGREPDRELRAYGTL